MFNCRIKRCSVRLYPQLFVGGRMSYLHYLCLFTYSGVQHIVCCVFVLRFFVYVAMFSGFSFVIVLSVFSNFYLVPYLGKMIHVTYSIVSPFLFTTNPIFASFC